MNALSSHRRKLGVLLAGMALLAGCDLFMSASARLARAEKLMAAADNRQAMVELKNVLQKEPQNARAHWDLANVSLRLGDAEGADRELGLALQAGFAGAAVADLRAQIYIGRRQYQPLLDALDARSVSLNEPARSLYVGQAYQGLARNEPAVAAFETALGHDPQLTAAHVGLAEASAATGDVSRGLKEIDTALGQKPNSAYAWMVRGSLLVKQGRLAEAESAFMKSHDYAAGQLTGLQYAGLLSSLAECRLGRGDTQGAEAMYSELSRLSADTPLAQLIAARIAMAKHDYVTAAADLQRLLSRYPDFVPGRVLLGVAQLQNGNLQQAQSELLQAVQLAPENVEAQSFLALVKAQLDGPAGGNGADSASADGARAAIQAYEANRQPGRTHPEEPLEKWLGRHPNDSTVRGRLAQAYQLSGRSHEAIAQYERLLSASPDNPVLLNNLAWLYYEAKDARAEAMARRAYQLLPKYPSVADTYGWILVENGKVAQGLEIFRALPLTVVQPDIEYHYAMALAKSGDTAGAKSMLAALLKDHPSFAERPQAERALDGLPNTPAGVGKRGS